MSVRVIKRQTSDTSSTCSPFKLPELGDPSHLAPKAGEKHHTASLSVPTSQPKPAQKPGQVAAPDSQITAEEADEILQAARSQAERVIAEAQARVAAIERETRERAQHDVQAHATLELERAVEDLRQEFTQSLHTLATLRAEIAAHAERDLVKLAIEMAKKIVQREVTVDHEVALTLARVALQRLHNRAVAKVRLHPDDYHYVSARREQAGADGSIEFIEDRLVGRGGCLVETEMGDIDARIEQQFAEIERNFLSG